MSNFWQSPPALAPILAVLYAVLLVLVFLRRPALNRLVLWTLIFLGLSAGWQLASERLVAADGSLTIWPAGLLVLGALSRTQATAHYLERPLPRWWLPLWAALTVLLAIWPGALPFAIPPFWRLASTAGQGGGFILWFILSLAAYGWSLLSTRQTRFPWHANRTLFWSIALLLTLAGDLLSLAQPDLLRLAGYGLRLAGACGLAYAAVTIVRVDLRTRFRRALARFFLLLLIALPAAGIYYLAFGLAAGFSPAAAALLLGGATALIFLLFLRVYRRLERTLFPVLLGRGLDANAVIRDYTQSIGSTLEIEQLSAVIFEKLDSLFGLSHGALMLVAPAAEQIAVEPLPAAGLIDRETRYLPADSRFLETLRTIHQPLLQFEIEFNPALQPLRREITPWLPTLDMELYAPIRSGGTLEGFIALGPKQSGLTYRTDELDLIQLLADQTAVALENARLYREVGTQNERVRHLNLDLRRQNDRLETLDRVKSDFITVASHELRTPLTQIKGYTDILTSLNEENALTREQTRQIIGQIERASGMLEQLISAMLDASQIDVDEMKINPTETHIETILRLALEPLSQAIRERQLQVTTDFEPGLPPILGDFKRLVQAFTNILSNGVKYTPDRGGITIRCRQISHADGPPALEIAITDTGIGIAQAYQQLIFDKFFRLGDTQLYSTSGTKFLGAGPGLGLTIARGVIEAHGGRIWVESEGEDRERLPGSTFTIILPLAPPSAPAANGAGKAGP